MKLLTDRQANIFAYVVDVQRRESRTPTLREMCEAFDIRSTNAMADHVDALEVKGFLRRVRRTNRLIVTASRDQIATVFDQIDGVTA
jgi:repressor LexA